MPSKQTVAAEKSKEPIKEGKRGNKTSEKAVKTLASPQRWQVAKWRHRSVRLTGIEVQGERQRDRKLAIIRQRSPTSVTSASARLRAGSGVVAVKWSNILPGCASFYFFLCHCARREAVNAKAPGAASDPPGVVAKRAVISRQRALTLIGH